MELWKNNTFRALLVLFILNMFFLNVFLLGMYAKIKRELTSEMQSNREGVLVIGEDVRKTFLEGRDSATSSVQEYESEMRAAWEKQRGVNP